VLLIELAALYLVNQLEYTIIVRGSGVSLKETGKVWVFLGGGYIRRHCRRLCCVLRWRVY